MEKDAISKQKPRVSHYSAMKVKNVIGICKCVIFTPGDLLTRGEDHALLRGGQSQNGQKIVFFFHIFILKPFKNHQKVKKKHFSKEKGPTWIIVLDI